MFVDTLSNRSHSTQRSRESRKQHFSTTFTNTELKKTIILCSGVYIQNSKLFLTETGSFVEPE
jgi:hypothetical protein